MKEILERKSSDWHAFMENNTICEGVNPMIAQSWIRSKSGGIDPYKISAKQLNKKELSLLRKKNRVLLECAVPLMDELAKIEAEHISLMSLHDSNGYMLELCNRQLPEIAWRDECFRPGVRWSEEDVGTNGLGLVIREKRPVQILGQEHYCFAQRDICCCAAPIFDEDGELAGVLNVCAKSENFSQHMMTLVVLATYAISNQIKAYSNYEIDNTILKVISESLMILDRRLLIIQCSRQAAEIFGAEPEDIAGHHIQDIIRIPELERCLASEDESFRCFECRGYFNGKSTRCDVSVTPVRRDGKTLAVALTIKSSRQIAREIVSKAGNCAQFTFDDIITADPKMFLLIDKMKETAMDDEPVLIEGESGTGKEVFAHAIHSESPRRDKPFLTVNCSSSPRRILGRELFGCEKDIYSGLLKNGSLGKLELGDGGTIFLDGIEKLSFELQKELLRVLSSGMLRRIGGMTERKIDIRLIAATHADLGEAVKRKLFLPELYAALSEKLFKIAPLRSRPGDIVLVAENVISDLNESEGTKKSISDELADALSALPWYGNSRELEDALISAYYRCEGGKLMPEHIKYQLESRKRHAGISGGAAADVQARDFALEDGGAQRMYIEEKLAECGFDVGAAADAMGISRATLYRRMKKYGIRRHEF